MSYRLMRQTLREMSLDQLERIRHELQTAKGAARSPAKKVKLDGLLSIVQAAIELAYERMECERDFAMCV